LESRPMMFPNGWCVHIEIHRGGMSEGQVSAHGCATEEQALQEAFRWGRAIVGGYYRRARRPGVEFEHNGKCWLATRETMTADSAVNGVNEGEERWVIGVVGSDSVRIGPLVDSESPSEAIANLKAFLGPSAQ
jgi:hypothetical protein